MSKTDHQPRFTVHCPLSTVHCPLFTDHCPKDPMRYLPKSPAERQQMLAEIGAASIDDLFSIIPAEYRLTRDLDVPRQQAESEIIGYFRAAGQKNATDYASFLGAGAY